MDPIKLDSSGDRFIVSIDKSIMDKSFLMEMLDRIRIEYLAQQIGFDKGIEKLGEEIKADWWEANKGRFIKED